MSVEQRDLVQLQQQLDALKEEVQRIKEGRFTPDELQNLCHNLSPEDRDKFFQGCTEYQRKLFGCSAVEELEKENTDLTRVNCQLAGKLKKIREQLKDFATEQPGDKEYHKEEDEWGYLRDEPCRYCRQVECVYFRRDQGVKDLYQPTVVRCNKCGKDWDADSSAA